jgi:hypothetical protein
MTGIYQSNLTGNFLNGQIRIDYQIASDAQPHLLHPLYWRLASDLLEGTRKMIFSHKSYCSQVSKGNPLV